MLFMYKMSHMLGNHVCTWYVISLYISFFCDISGAG